MPIKLFISLFFYISFITNGLCQSVTGPQHSNAPLNITDGSTSCYPYSLTVSNGTLACSNGIATVTTGGGGGGGSPGGTGTNIQYRAGASTFGGISGSAVDSNGNVGLGSTSPGQRLDVNGTIRTNGAFQGNILNGYLDNKPYLDYSNNDGSVWMGDYLQNYAGAFIFIQQGVNIDVDNASLPFEVGQNYINDGADNLSIGGKLTVGIAQATPGGGAMGEEISVNNSDDPLTDITTAHLDLENPTGTQSKIIFTFNNIAVGGVRGDNVGNFNWHATGSQGHQFYASIDTSSPIMGISASGVEINKGLAATATSELTVSGNESIGASYNGTQAPSNGLIVQGNVGIGTLAPLQRLDVSGTVRMTNARITSIASGTQCLQADSSGTISGTGSGCGGSGTVSSGTTNQVAKYTASTTVGSGIITDDGTNVGISTTIPNSKLDVNGTLNFSGGNPTIQVSSITSVGGTGTGTALAINAGSYLSGATGNGGALTLNGGIGSGGGTNGGGTIKDGTGGINGGNVSLITNNASTIPGNVLLIAGTGNASNGNIIMTATPSSTLAGGNVGIGTVIPRAFLDVAGTVPGTVFAFTKLGNVGIGTWLPNGALTVMNGNVGIGTLSPGNALDVNGTIRSLATGNSYFMSNVGIGTTLNSTLNGALIVTGNMGIGSFNPQAALTIGTGGHIKSNGSAPTVANNDCGTTSQGTVTAGSTDIKGSFVVGTLTVTSCAVTFNTTFGVAPICITQDDTNILGVKTATTTTKMTTTSTTSMSGDTVNYVCFE